MLISLMNGSDKDQRLDGYRVGESVAGAAPTHCSLSAMPSRVGAE